MAQYIDGQMIFTPGSNRVVLVGGDFYAAGVQPGMLVSRQGANAPYYIGAIVSATEADLTGPYFGAAETADYFIQIDQTLNGRPRPGPNDRDVTLGIGLAFDLGDAALNKKGFVKRSVFRDTGVWTPHADTKFIIVYVIAGGGGGAANSAGPLGSGGGGGGGGCAIKVIYVFGANETVTIGPGGLGATTEAADGVTGSASSFGTHCSATPGWGGTRALYGGAGGRPGTGVGGDLNLNGSPGGAGSTAGYWYAVGGAAAWIGGGGSNVYDAVDGAGGASTPTVLSTRAKNGGKGLVIIEEYN